LLTDFGRRDYFVAAMKGVILSSNPNAQLIDISHEIPPQDIEAAAFTLVAAYPSFSAGTIHLVVVDPGVGSTRRAIIVNASDQFFVGPDNGIFSYIIDREPSACVFEITNRSYFRQPISKTFHGRDIFAPVAAVLAAGTKPEELGKTITDPVQLQPLTPIHLDDGRLRARIIHIDSFGNCVTNLTENDLTPELIAAGARMYVKGRLIRKFRQYFAEAEDGETLFGVWGSAGFLEIASRNRSAAKLLKARRGDTVTVSGV